MIKKESNVKEKNPDWCVLNQICFIIEKSKEICKDCYWEETNAQKRREKIDV